MQQALAGAARQALMGATAQGLHVAPTLRGSAAATRAYRSQGAHSIPCTRGGELLWASRPAGCRALSAAARPADPREEVAALLKDEGSDAAQCRELLDSLYARGARPDVDSFTQLLKRMMERSAKPDKGSKPGAIPHQNEITKSIWHVHSKMMEAGVPPNVEWFKTAIAGAVDGGDLGCGIQLTHLAFYAGFGASAPWYTRMMWACVDENDGTSALMLIQDMVAGGGLPSRKEIQLAVEACVAGRQPRNGNLLAACEILSIVRKIVDDPKRDIRLLEIAPGDKGSLLLAKMAHKISETTLQKCRFPFMQVEALEVATRLHYELGMPALEEYMKQNPAETGIFEIGGSAPPPATGATDHQDFLFRACGHDVMEIMLMTGANMQAFQAYWDYRKGISGVPSRIANRIASEMLFLGMAHEARQILEDDQHLASSPSGSLATALAYACIDKERDWADKLRGMLKASSIDIERQIKQLNEGEMRGGIAEKEKLEKLLNLIHVSLEEYEKAFRGTDASV